MFLKRLKCTIIGPPNTLWFFNGITQILWKPLLCLPCIAGWKKGREIRKWKEYSTEYTHGRFSPHQSTEENIGFEQGRGAVLGRRLWQPAAATKPSARPCHAHHHLLAECWWCMVHTVKHCIHQAGLYYSIMFFPASKMNHRRFICFSKCKKKDFQGKKKFICPALVCIVQGSFDCFRPLCLPPRTGTTRSSSQPARERISGWW